MSSDQTPTLYLLCGKIAAGKTTLAEQLANQPGTVLVAEDAWLNALFADELTSGPDYVRCATKLRSIMGPHVSDLLTAGVSVVLDFPANTIETRRWMTTIFKESTSAHQLHVLDTSEKRCLERLRARNASGTHPFHVSEELFRRFSSYYEPPTPEEGFNLIWHHAEP
ncbi:putative kinase [Roseibium hamelinense]|uniref:Putative kinase n=1 Tax=Roseibium hamelinense TaxID=150831 RepID=A0A562SU47_9HYPH|nr:ATP-binding protein [Roseibium hamelinense]MTI42733.1 ATP-binding protein [Roseibium hamelinense]TWI84613.1 putative kinase [Roseibium hamelinense]